MIKAGLITALISLLIALGATLLSPMCTPCAAIFLGLAAGLLAGVFDKPSDLKNSAKAGAAAGAIGGIGTIIGQMVGAVINVLVVGPEGAALFLQRLGIDPGSQSGFESSYWGGVIGGALCFSFLDIVLMAGFGALGCIVWQKIFWKDKSPQLKKAEEIE